jgi:hypothetical protein
LARLELIVLINDDEFNLARFILDYEIPCLDAEKLNKLQAELNKLNSEVCFKIALIGDN